MWYLNGTFKSHSIGIIILCQFVNKHPGGQTTNCRPMPCWEASHHKPSTLNWQEPPPHTATSRSPLPVPQHRPGASGRHGLWHTGDGRAGAAITGRTGANELKSPHEDAAYCGHDHPDTPSAFRARTWKKYQPWSVGRLLTSALVPVIVIVMPLTGALVESRT